MAENNVTKAVAQGKAAARKKPAGSGGKPSRKSTSAKVKVGDTVDVTDRVVGLPDGSVVSTYETYTFTLPGKHNVDGKTVDVADAPRQARAMVIDGEDEG